MPRATSAAGLLMIASCATAGLPGTPIEPAPVVRMAERENAFDAPTHITFEWSLDEPGLRAQGRGVARLEPPNRARLDLFARSGETVATAALVGSELRVPSEVPDLIPPPALLWAALGIFLPGEEATLLGSEAEDGGDVHHLRYRLPDELELRYVLRSGRVSGAELVRDGRTVQNVALADPLEGDLPGAATYRDLTAFRELKVTVESVEYVDEFPTEIWNPGR